MQSLFLRDSTIDEYLKPGNNITERFS